MSWPARLPPVPVLATRAAFAERQHRIVYVHRGVHAMHVYDYHAEFRCAGRSFALLPGSVSVSPMGIPTSYHLERPGSHWCVHFLPGRAAGPRLGLPTVLHVGPQASYVRERMARISGYLSRAAGGDRPSATVAAGGVLLELLAWIAGGCDIGSGDGERSYRAVELTARRIRERPDESLDTATLARSVGLSPNWLARRFRCRFGVTIPRYRLEQRIAQARLLLSATALPIGEIGRRIGYPDPHHFSKVFSRVAGHAPSAGR